MSRLYCEADGKRYSKFLSEGTEDYNGEGIVITKGPLDDGEYLCDKCNTPLREDDIAYLISFLTPEMVNYFANYDFAEEYEYFKHLDPEEIELFGLEWPG